MIGRRSLLGGVMVSWGVGRPGGSGFGGNPPMRPDQVSQRPRTVAGSGPAPQQSVITARKVIVGPNGAPQIILDSNLDIPVSFLINTGGGSAAPGNVASVSPIIAAMRMPTGHAGEAVSSLVAPIVVTYTDGSVADGVLTLTGFYTGSAGAAGSAFVLVLGESNSTSASTTGGTFLGAYAFAGGAVTLTPVSVQPSNSENLVFYGPPGAGPVISDQDPESTASLVPNAEFFHAMPLNAAWSAVAGHHTPGFRLNALGNVEITGRVSGNPATANITTLPAGYFSASNSMTIPCSVSNGPGGVNAGQTPRLTLDTGGNITLAGLGNGAGTIVDVEGTFMLSAG